MQIRTAEFHYPSADGHSQIYAESWIPDNEAVTFLLQISHGMADFAHRYDELARFLAANGGAVYGNDHLGHGHTPQPGEPFGYFGKNDGDRLVVEDMYTLTKLMRAQYPGVPVFLFGHSMGSLLARDYCTRYGEYLDGAVYSGTSGANNLTGIVRLLAGMRIRLGAGKKPAKLLTRLAFSNYNDRIDNPRTANDWLTRDEKVVDTYNANPWNTFLFTNQAAYDFAVLIDRVSGKEWASRLPENTGYLLISGEMDPVGDYGKGVEQVYGWMREADLDDVTLKIYPQARHELTNELNREEVFADLLSWISMQIMRCRKKGA